VRALATLQLLGWDSKGKHILLSTRDAHYPVYARQSTSDLGVFEQIFVHKEYSALDDMKFKVIVDCGAYVGYSTVYFLNKFPDSRVVAIEADGANFDVCKLNLSPYEHRVKLLHSAIWSRKADLVVVRGKYRDGREWASQVRECISGEIADVRGRDLLSLIDDAGLNEIDLLKVDIEGAERVVFKEDCEAWLRRVRNIAIELHDSECRSVFFAALSHYDYDLSRSGELTICKNLTHKKHASSGGNSRRQAL
jgi:FkbM family methyltransferase